MPLSAAMLRTVEVAGLLALNDPTDERSRAELRDLARAGLVLAGMGIGPEVADLAIEALAELELEAPDRQVLEAVLEAVLEQLRLVNFRQFEAMQRAVAAMATAPSTCPE